MSNREAIINGLKAGLNILKIHAADWIVEDTEAAIAMLESMKDPPQRAEVMIDRVTPQFHITFSKPLNCSTGEEIRFYAEVVKAGE